jgi:hypothetical protein
LCCTVVVVGMLFITDDVVARLALAHWDSFQRLNVWTKEKVEQKCTCGPNMAAPVINLKLSSRSKDRQRTTKGGLCKRL